MLDVQIRQDKHFEKKMSIRGEPLSYQVIINKTNGLTTVSSLGLDEMSINKQE